MIPLPEFVVDDEDVNNVRLVIPRMKFDFFRLLNSSDLDYDSYVQRTGLAVEDRPWMA